MILYRSDNSKKFQIFKATRPEQELSGFKHSPAFLMTYLSGVYTSPQAGYAKAYPQPYLYKLKFSGKVFKLPQDFKKIPAELKTVGEFEKWLKKSGYDAVLGKNAAQTSAGTFDEVVVFDPRKLTVVSEKEKGIFEQSRQTRTSKINEALLKLRRSLSN